MRIECKSTTIYRLCHCVSIIEPFDLTQDALITRHDSRFTQVKFPLLPDSLYISILIPPSPITSTDYAPRPTDKTKAVQWMGRRDLEVGLVLKPTITDPSDAIIQVTHCTISGSDLHRYVGDLGDAMRKGDIMGREAIGLVETLGPKVKSRKAGDRGDHTTGDRVQELRVLPAEGVFALRCEQPVLRDGDCIRTSGVRAFRA